MAVPEERKSRDAKQFLKDNKKSIIIGAIILAVAFGGTFGVFYILKAVMKTDYPIVVVTSDSMYPNIERGDMLFVKYKAPEDIRASDSGETNGDVIIYDTHGIWMSPRDEPIVHRVINKTYDADKGIWIFTTMGDNNPGPDEVPVPETNVLGVVVGRIPKIGMVKIWLEMYDLAVPLIILLGFLLVITVIYDILHPEEEKKDAKEKKDSITRDFEGDSVSPAMKSPEKPHPEEKSERKDVEFDLGV